MTPPGGPEAADWDHLLDRVGNGDPFRRSPVLSLLAEHDTAPRMVAVRRNGRLVAAAPLAASRHRGLRELHTLGPQDNFFDPEPPAEDADAAARLVAALAAEGADLVTFPEVRPGGLLARAVAARGRATARPVSPTYRVRSEEVAARLAGRRREAARILRRAARGGARVEAVTLDDWREVRAVLDEAMLLHRRRWEGRVADPLVATAAGRDLVRAILERLGPLGALRLTCIRHDGALAAFALAAVCPAGAVMYRTAHDRSLPDASGLGSGVLVASIDALVAEGVDGVDLGCGGDSFKRHFADPSPVVTLQVPTSRAGRLFLSASAVRRAARRALGARRPSARGGATGREGVGSGPSVT